MWSKIKKNIESNFSEKLKDKIQIYTTTYTKNYDSGDLSNRGWITVNGKEVVNFSTPDSFRLNSYVYNFTTPTNFITAEKVTIEERSPEQLTEKGEFSKFDLSNCCYAFLEMSIEEGLNHESPIINMLSVLDKRLGKRRLLKLNDQNLHPLVKYFLNLRLEAENIKINNITE